MNNPTAALKRLNEDRPEWRPWLVVLDELLSEATEPRWDDCVPVFSECRAHVPRLAKASIAIPRDLLRRWIMRLLRAAAARGAPAARGSSAFGGVFRRRALRGRPHPR